MTEQFGNKIKRHRCGVNVSLADVCNSTSIDEVMMQHVEDNRALPSKIMIEKLAACSALKLTYTILKDWRDLDSKIIFSPLWNIPKQLWPYCSEFHL